MVATTIEFLDNHQIDWVPYGCLRTRQPDGSYQKAYNPLNVYKIGIPQDGYPVSNDWEHNHKYMTNIVRHKWDAYLDQVAYENAHTYNEGHQELSIVAMCDTRMVCMFDQDHPNAEMLPVFRKLMAECPRTQSPSKKLWKGWFLLADKPEHLPQNVKLADGWIELQNGLWSGVPIDGEVVNAEMDLPTISWNEFKDLAERDYSTKPLNRITESEHTFEEIQSAMDTLIDYDRRIRTYQPNGGYGDTYQGWRDVAFFLKAELNDERGYELFHDYSKTCNKYNPSEWATGYVKYLFIDKIGQADSIVPLFKAVSHQKQKWARLQREFRAESVHTTSDSESSDDVSSVTSSSTQQANDDNIVSLIVRHLNDETKNEESFPMVLLKCMKNINCSMDNYKRFKSYIREYTDHEFEDDQMGEMMKKWRKSSPPKKYGLGHLKELLQMDNPQMFKNLFPTSFRKSKYPTYEKVKEEFEKTTFKIMSPMGYGHVRPNGEFEFLNHNKVINKFRHMKYDCEGKSKQFIFDWVNDASMRVVNRFSFNPTTTERIFQEDGETIFNLFEGLRGSKLPRKTSPHLDELLNFVKRQLCDNNDAFFDYLIKWLACIIQKTGQKTRVAPILTGRQGTGKTMFMEWFAEYIIGKKYSYITAKAQNVLGRFNAKIETVIFCVLNEISRKDTQDENNQFKELITDHSIDIERKGVDTITQPNFTSFVITTNSLNPVMIEFGDRRFTGIESEAKRLSPEEALYMYKNLLNGQNEDLNSAFYYYLLDMDLTNYDTVQSRVQTNFYKMCQNRIVPELVLFMHYAITSENVNLTEVYLSDLYNEYVLWKGHRSKQREPPSFNSFTNSLIRGTDFRHCYTKIRVKKDKYVFTFDTLQLMDRFSAYDMDNSDVQAEEVMDETKRQRLLKAEGSSTSITKMTSFPNHDDIPIVGLSTSPVPL